MKITYHGYSCFSIKSELATVVMDPYNRTTKIILQKLKADIVTVSYDNNLHGAKEVIDGDFLLLDTPGEYERKGVFCKGVGILRESDEKENTIFIVSIGGKTVCHLGALDKELTEEKLDKIGDIDVLMVPVGGGDVLEAKKAVAVIDELEPRIVIPMQYQIPGMGDENLAEVLQFEEVMGKKGILVHEELDIGKTSLPKDQTDIYVLKAMHV